MFEKIFSKLPFGKKHIKLSKDNIEKANQITNKYPLPIVTIEIPVTPTKEQHEMWKELVALLFKANATILNISDENTPKIKDIVNIRENRSLEELLAIVRNSDLHIGIVSPLMHAIAQANRAAIIILNSDENISNYKYKTIISIKSSSSNYLSVKKVFKEVKKLINFELLQGNNS